MRKRQSGKIALCGVICALVMVIMLSGSILPFATFCAPALGGIMLMAIAMECGMRLAWMCYGTVGVLSLLFVPDKEAVAIFIFFFGYYPLLKAYLQRIHSRILQIAIKLLAFNAAVISMYAVLLYLFPIQSLVQEFAETTKLLLAALLAMGNASFLVYDAALVNLLHFYVIKVKPKLRQIL